MFLLHCSKIKSQVSSFLDKFKKTDYYRGTIKAIKAIKAKIHHVMINHL